MLKLLLITLIVLAIAILAIAIKLFINKEGQFTKMCSSMDPTNKKVACACHAKKSALCDSKFV